MGIGSVSLRPKSENILYCTMSLHKHLSIYIIYRSLSPGFSQTLLGNRFARSDWFGKLCRNLRILVELKKKKITISMMNIINNVRIGAHSKQKRVNDLCI